MVIYIFNWLKSIRIYFFFVFFSIPNAIRIKNIIIKICVFMTTGQYFWIMKKKKNKASPPLLGRINSISIVTEYLYKLYANQSSRTNHRCIAFGLCSGVQRLGVDGCIVRWFDVPCQYGYRKSAGDNGGGIEEWSDNNYFISLRYRLRVTLDIVYDLYSAFTLYFRIFLNTIHSQPVIRTGILCKRMRLNIPCRMCTGENRRTQRLGNGTGVSSVGR